MMRFFKAYKERKSDEAQKSSPESDTKRSDSFFQRSIVRTVSSLFGRYQDEEDDVDDDDSGKANVSHSVTSASDIDGSTPARRHRWRSLGGGGRGVDIDRAASETAESSSDNSFPLARSRNCLSDDDFAIRRASSSSNLPSAPAWLRGLSDSSVVGGRRSRRGSTDTPCSDPRYSSASSDDERVFQTPEKDLRTQFMASEALFSSRFRDRVASGGSSPHMDDPRFFRIKHAAANLGGGGDASGEGAYQSDSPEGERKRDTACRWRLRDRRFFSLRRSISSLRRSLSTPKAGDRQRDDSESESRRVGSMLSRYISHSDRDDDSSGSMTDSDKSPNRFRIAFGLDLPSLSAIISSDSLVSREESVGKGRSSEPITSRKERVVVLSAGPSPTPDPTTPVTSAKWDPQSVRKIEDTFSVLPMLKDIPMASRAEIFQRKLIACQTVIDFGSKKVMQRAIELKRQTLLEIIEYISTTRNCVNERLLQDVIDMVEANIFRSLPPREKKSTICFDTEEDEPTLEKSWPHLQIVYDVFLRVIVSNEVTSKMVKNVIDKPFVLKLLNVLSSEDQRERDYLKTILHRIYGKIMPLRNFIRKAMDNVFTNFIYETQNPYGITELLEILGSIINGFAVPLKEEHKVYLEKSLTPLHKPKSVRVYHAALSYCMIQYINKDRSLAGVILRSILKFWPTTSAQTEILFLNELEEVLSLTELTELNEFVRPIARRLSQCVASVHFQVAERSLYVWNNSRVVRQLNMNKAIVYPYIVPALKANIDGHWNEAVRSLTSNVAKMMSEYDAELYNSCEFAVGSSRRFPAVTLTPKNSWEIVAPSARDKHELLESVTSLCETHD